MTGSASPPPPVYMPGDVVYGADPFKGESTARPWLIISNHEGKPFHGEQYIALTLTTRSWLDGLIEIPDDAWLRGGTPRSSRSFHGVCNRLDKVISIIGRDASQQLSRTALGKRLSNIWLC